MKSKFLIGGLALVFLSTLAAASEKKKVNPVPNVPQAIAAGKATFSSQCAMCHGPAGDGKGDLAIEMKMKVPSFATAAWQVKRTEGEIFDLMTTGHGDMPPEKRLPDQAKWEIVRFIRSLAPEQAIVRK